MKRLFFPLFVCIVLSVSCNRDDTDVTYLKATVIITKDLSCYVPVLSFEEDSVRIKLATKKEGLLYGVIGLPDSLRMEGKLLFVRVKPLPSNEEFACNTLGISYPHLKVIDAKRR